MSSTIAPFSSSIPTGARDYSVSTDPVLNQQVKEATKNPPVFQVDPRLYGDAGSNGGGGGSSSSTGGGNYNPQTQQNTGYGTTAMPEFMNLLAPAPVQAPVKAPVAAPVAEPVAAPVVEPVSASPVVFGTTASSELQPLQQSTFSTLFSSSPSAPQLFSTASVRNPSSASGAAGAGSAAIASVTARMGSPEASARYPASSYGLQPTLVAGGIGDWKIPFTNQTLGGASAGLLNFTQKAFSGSGKPASKPKAVSPSSVQHGSGHAPSARSSGSSASKASTPVQSDNASARQNNISAPRRGGSGGSGGVQSDNAAPSYNNVPRPAPTNTVKVDGKTYVVQKNAAGRIISANGQTLAKPMTSQEFWAAKHAAPKTKLTSTVLPASTMQTLGIFESPKSGAYLPQQTLEKSNGIDTAKGSFNAIKSNNLDIPNIFNGLVPRPHQSIRSGFNRALEADNSDPKKFDSAAAMFVPNIVFELGPAKASGQAVSGKSITPQPATLFVPYSKAESGFNQKISGSSLLSVSEHSAGFYPGDTNSIGVLKTSLLESPGSNPAAPFIPQYSMIDYGFNTNTITKSWSQTYYNAPIADSPIGASINYRYIPYRAEIRTGLYQKSTILQNGRSTYESAVTPYSWAQLNAPKIGLSGVTSGNVTPYAKGNIQAEIGIYGGLVSATANTPYSKPEAANSYPVDWRIVNGKITSDSTAIFNQFSDVKKKTGLNIKSESVVPDWKDNSAGVYVQVPGAINKGMASSEVTYRSGDKPMVKVDDLVQLLNSAGENNPARYKELKFITKQNLLDLNGSRVQTRIDLNTGKTNEYVDVGNWLNLGLRVINGQNGLYLPQQMLKVK
jgi:hypothetical protein